MRHIDSAGRIKYVFWWFDYSAKNDILETLNHTSRHFLKS